MDNSVNKGFIDIESLQKAERELRDKQKQPAGGTQKALSPDKQKYIAQTKKDIDLVAKLLKARSEGDSTYFPPLPVMNTEQGATHGPA